MLSVPLSVYQYNRQAVQVQAGMLEVKPVTLTGEFVRLEPASAAHGESLSRYATMDTFDYFVTGRPTSIDERGLVEFISRTQGRSDTQSFAVVLLSSGHAVGMTSYMDIRPPHYGLEIGMTWYAEALRGTVVNPECKLLLLTHAFERLNCVRVQLKTDARNLASQAAIRKLGAKYEGTLRSHGIMPDGFVRDTVMFSFIREEWPAAKARLLDRIASLR